MRTSGTARCCGVAASATVLLVVSSMASVAQPAPSPASRAPAPAAASLLVGGTMDIRWSAPLAVVAGSAPVADATTAYVVTRTPAIVALDLISGATRWQVEAATRVPPVIGAGLAFVVVEDGMRALRADTGATAWQRPLESGVAAAPSVGPNQLVVSLANGDVVALRPNDGTVLWRTSLGAVAGIAPVPAGDRWYLALSDGRIVALEAGSGHPQWTRPFESPATGVSARDDLVLVATAGGSLLSLDPRNGRTRWRWRLGTPVAGTPAVDARHVYVVGFDHLLRALDRRSGNLRWRRALPHRPASGPVLAGDTVIVPSLSTEIPTFAAATGTPGAAIASASEVGSALYFLSAASATGTRLLAVTTEGGVVAFKSRIEPAPTALADLPGVPVPETPAVQTPPAPRVAPLR